MTPSELVELEISGWNPKPGDKLSGTVIDRDDGVQGGFEPYTMLTIQTGDRTAVHLHCFHGVLRGMVESKDPQPGDIIAVKYLGKRPTTREGAKYASYEAYNFAVQKPAAPAPAPARAEDVPLPSEADRPLPDEEDAR
jgi:hypothetical protein